MYIKRKKKKGNMKLQKFHTQHNLQKKNNATRETKGIFNIIILKYG